MLTWHPVTHRLRMTEMSTWTVARQTCLLSAFGYTMERQGQAQAFDLATNFLMVNGYLSPTNAATNRAQSWSINPMSTQWAPALSQVTSVPPSTANVNVMQNFRFTRQVSQLLSLALLPPVRERMVGVESMKAGRSASIQPRGFGTHNSHSSFSSHHSHTHIHSRGLSTEAGAFVCDERAV